LPAPGTSYLVAAEAVVRNCRASRIADEQMHREAAAKLDTWNIEQQAKAEAERKGQVKRFTKRQATG